MPAAAVIPAPIANIKVVAVEKLVVEYLEAAAGLPRLGCVLSPSVFILAEMYQWAFICRWCVSRRLL